MDQSSNQKPEDGTRLGLSSRAVGMAIVLFVLIVVGMFMFTFIKQQEIANEAPAPTEEPLPPEVKYASITRVDAKHFFDGKTHTLVGEMAMPTPCDLLEAESIVAESFPEQVTIDFSVINNAEFCAQVITPQRFLVTANASEEATFSARLEGRAIELNLIPAAEGETPDSFELFIKG